MIRPSSTSGPLWFAAFVSVVCLACANNADYLREARTVEYSADYPKVWNAVSSTFHRQYSNFAREDADQGVIITQWSRVSEEESAQTRKLYGASGPSMIRIGAYVHRGDKGWTVAVRAAGASHDTAKSKLQQFAETDRQQPRWVQERIDKVYSEIYQQLYGSVVPGSAAPPTPEEEARLRRQVFGK